MTQKNPPHNYIVEARKAFGIQMKQRQKTTETVLKLRFIFILLAYKFTGWGWVTQFQSQEAVL